MTLTSHTDFAAFLETVQQCRGEVLFCTREGDKLNLKCMGGQIRYKAGRNHSRKRRPP